jgi:hypothetical protein
MSEVDETEKKEKRTRETSAYPKRSLMNALQIANAIKEHNAGNPYDRLDLAKAVNRSPSSSEFRMLITSSGQYGLTEGSYSASSIALTPVGQSIVFPKSASERAEGLKKALFSIPLYAKFYTDFNNNKLPPMEYLVGTLNRTYNIPVDECKNAYELIVKNATELGILDDIGGAQYIHLNKLGGIVSIETPATGGTVAPVAVSPAQQLTEPQIKLPVTGSGVNLTVNINLELPVSKDAEVYDKIFESLKRNLISPKSAPD